MMISSVTLWVPVAAAAVGAAPGLLSNRWNARDDARSRREDLVRSACRDLVAESVAATFRPSIYGRRDVRNAVRWRWRFAFDQLSDMEGRVSRIAAAKAEFDLLVDSDALHDAADALLEAVNRSIALNTGDAAPTERDAQTAMELVRDARQEFNRRVRHVVPPLAVDRRRWLRRRRGVRHQKATFLAPED